MGEEEEEEEKTAEGKKVELEKEEQSEAPHGGAPVVVRPAVRDPSEGRSRLHWYLGSSEANRVRCVSRQGDSILKGWEWIPRPPMDPGENKESPLPTQGARWRRGGRTGGRGKGGERWTDALGLL